MRHERKTHNINPTTTFIALAAVAALLTFVNYRFSKITIQDTTSNVALVHNENTQKVELPDTSSWSTYTHPTNGLSFKYPSDWSTKLTREGTIEVISIKPPKSSPIVVYISREGYYATDGLPLKQTQIQNMPAVIVDDSLVGIKRGDLYFTFDEGLDQNNKANFTAFLGTISFN